MTMQGRVRILVVLFIGGALGYGLAVRPRLSVGAGAGWPSAAPALGRAPVGAGTVWLEDFEGADEDLERHWQQHGVHAVRAQAHATHGRFAAKVTYDASESPSFALHESLARDRARRNPSTQPTASLGVVPSERSESRDDWRGYETLRFDLYNPQRAQERLILHLKDGEDREYKEDIFINGESAQSIAVHLPELKDYLNLSRMAQFNLFRWNPKRVSTFYVDAIRLEPSTHGAGRPDAPAAQIAVTDQWQVVWATSLTKLFRDPAAFTGYRTGPVEAALARGEAESVQVALIGGLAPTEVRVRVEALTHEDGATVWPAQTIEVRRVGYVTTVPPYYPVTFVGDWPDPLPLAEVVEVPPGEVQPVWITLRAPDALRAGTYRGTVTLTDGQGRTESLPLSVRVWNFTLPRRSHLKTAFDFYRPRMEQAYREFVPGGDVWEGRMDELQHRYYVDMLRHRLAPILGIDPTSALDWDRLQAYLRLGLGTFGIGDLGGSHGNNWPEDPITFAQTMVWYRQAAAALRSQQLLPAAYVYAYDEPQPGDTRVTQVMRAIHEADPELHTLLVMHQAPDPAQHAAWLADADILCIRIASFDAAHAERFRDMGKEMWMYVSSPAPPFPSLVIDSPAVAHRILPWMCWKVKASGLLYWCVNFWKTNPWVSPATFAQDQNGNGSLYYPALEGPVPSIRLEVLRDGLEDYEYLYRLQQLANTAARRPETDRDLLERARGLLAIDAQLIESLRSYSKDPERLLSARRTMGETIEQLERFLGQPQ